MNLVKFNAVAKEFSGQSLFSKVSFELNSFEKVALIGANGTGKSTIVKLILGDLTPDAGDVFVNRQVRIGYLSQSVIEDDSKTLIETMKSVYSSLIAMEIELKKIMEQMSHDHSESTILRYARLEDEFLHLGGYDYLTRIDFVLTRFGFKKEVYDRVISSFSGGEKTRVAFAKLLLEQPELLILDEPTNHMDIEIIEWLEDYLKKYPGAVFIITHDKYFINKVVTKIYELDQQSIDVYYGNFDAYEIEKVKRYELLLRSYQRQTKEIAHLQSFVDRFRYKATKAKSAQDRIKKIARIERIEKPTNDKDSVRFKFKTKRPTEAIILTTQALCIGYITPLQPAIDFTMRGFDKVGIIGPNGIGKTTFIKTIMQSIEPITGMFEFHKDYKIGYFDQNLAQLNPNFTVIESVHGRYPMKTLGEIRSLLARFLFTDEDVFKSVGVLSGGEKVRLSLCLLMLEEPEFLILDEPTNHLDMDTKNVVEDVFEEWVGPMLFISHDRYFINKVANKIMHFERNGITVFDGNYDEYKEERAKRNQEVKVEKPAPKRNTRSKADLQKLELQLETISSEIEQLRQSLFLEEVYSFKERYYQVETQIIEKEQQLEQIFHEIAQTELN
ncbi:MAG: ABC-F family ATP-binding cassette domain-containing protein [bacterium]|nr:ABC-F family ATP-binding cassette domain-containing protein [bacterium]